MIIEPEVGKWIPPQPTRYNLDWADLATIDLSIYDKPGGKQQLAAQLKRIVENDGFWAVVGTGITQEEMNRVYSLGNFFFMNYTEEQKRVQEVDFEHGNYFGYKVRGNKTVFGTKVKDNVETFNIAKFTEDGLFEPYFKQDFISRFHDELERISKRLFEVARKLLVLFAIILELEENYFVDRHRYNDPSDDHLRFMKYHPRSQEDDNLVENTWARGHTDFGTLTLLFNQLVSGLQIKTSSGKWRYVRPVDGGIICNVGDTLSFWSGGYFKSTIHRVVRPPPDQVDAPRIGVFYFVRPGDHAQVEVAPSPLLRQLGLYKPTQPITGTEYVRARVRDYHYKSEYLKQNNVKFRVGEFEIKDGFE
ncbi:Piso0_000496 [Millerozyma farinosa CBS 7064]|uniref:Piso0_000496 protein n=1 Tax=Pichia sorbitophila (strain ATCC MYA-4447 / BCRC 22081 / CBS 7064 / NBRC 10061 / NRRL Y-12695) TaxID=559304 RepID=G8YVL1_PICSO|nr:Piso0_000496 [Millerozyma farinosa CBS 7064]CCE73455.1 Piso0_000496 [Millerozyma farinosa CBS 7064]